MHREAFEAQVIGEGRDAANVKKAFLYSGNTDRFTPLFQKP